MKSCLWSLAATLATFGAAFAADVVKEGDRILRAAVESHLSGKE